MARRARSAPKITWLLGGLGIVAALVVAVQVLLGGQPFRTVPELPVEQYLGESSSLRGNTYRISGKVLNSIAWSPSEGRLISVQPSGSRSPIPVVLPASLSGTNVQKGESFHFRVEVRENGILYTTDIAKATPREIK